MSDKPSLSSGIVWLAAGFGLTVYATIGLMLTDIPGIQELTAWLESLSGSWVLLAAFIAMFLEGLYIIGSFFPGTSVVVVLAIVAGTISWPFFLALLAVIYTAWTLAGIVNITLAKQIARETETTTDVQEDRILETWFPAFRANHEVAQILSGMSRWSVFLSSARVKLFGILVFTIHGAVVPLFLDVTDATNQEGFRSLYIFAAIMIGVGAVQVWSYYNPKLES